METEAEEVQLFWKRLSFLRSGICKEVPWAWAWALLCLGIFMFTAGLGVWLQTALAGFPGGRGEALLFFWGCHSKAPHSSLKTDLSFLEPEAQDKGIPGASGRLLLEALREKLPLSQLLEVPGVLGVTTTLVAAPLPLECPSVRPLFSVSWDTLTAVGPSAVHSDFGSLITFPEPLSKAGLALMFQVGMD